MSEEMTRAEMLKTLSEMQAYHDKSRFGMALSMAVAALKAEPITGHWIDRKVIEDIKAEIEEPLHENRTINTDDARAQAIALMWCLQTIDKHIEKWEADNA